MKYWFLAYRDEKQWTDLSAGLRETIQIACRASEEELRQRGFLIAAVGMQTCEAAITLRVVDGELILAQGGSLEMSGQLDRLLLIEARDLNEAIQAAVKLTQARLGHIAILPEGIA